MPAKEIETAEANVEAALTSDSNLSGDLTKASTDQDAEKAAPSAETNTRPKPTAEELDQITQLRSQVKMALSSGYTAMISFHAEWDRYSTDMNAIGFGPMGGPIAYKVGFLVPFVPSRPDPQTIPENPNNMSTDAIAGQKYDAVGENVNLNDFARYCERGCTASENEFELIAVLPLPNSATPDIWLINEKKEIRQAQDGLQ